MYFFQKNKFKIMLIATTVILVLIVVSGASSKRRKASVAEEVVGGVIAPVQDGVSSVSGSTKGFFNYLRNMKGYEEENQKLRDRVAQLEDKLRKTESLKNENERLRGLLELKQAETEYNTVAADVIAFGADNFSRNYTINKGLKDGITENCAVITANGLVGYVFEVGRNWSKVCAITNPDISVSASVMRVGNTAIVQGDLSLMEKGMCKMAYVSKEAGLEVGDFVETSGAGGIIPAGIYIGKIQEIKDDVTGVSQEAIINPGVDFSDIDEVLVIKKN